MSTPSSVHVDNQHAHIGMQVVAERVFFGGEEPAELEREALRERIVRCFAKAVERGELGFDDRVEIDRALQRLLGTRGEWLETPACRLASVVASVDAREDLRLPLELLRPPTGAEPVLVRCALAQSQTVPEGPRAYPEGGRIVLVTADAGGPIADDALRQAMLEVCRTGLHLASGSEHDRKRGAFDPELDHLPRASRAALQQMLAKLGATDADIEAQWNIGVAHIRRGDEALHSDDVDVARKAYEAAHDIAAKLEQRFPFSSEVQRYLSVSLENLGRVEVQAGNLAAARDLFQRSLQTREGLAKADPHSAQAQRDLSISLEKLGNVEVQSGNLAAARGLFQRSLQTREGLAKADPHSAQASFDLATSHQWLAHAAKAEGDRDTQIDHLRTARAILDTMEASGQYRGYTVLEHARRYIDSQLGES
ncbi:tetratricopeptide repeat protein [Paraliomyxa miuraensis]|uniref:tetratricopeptide repeat protein n=1 Tax=Paraliomyxa miuraensis TaxID=376150 RepID=UPI00225A3609|nr:tetratricopeptide repeat protein [Paraliomyxa miuraensis]MCX4239751.1 tetratricopeptide repeat protein [Paraliomyxa miuraensis]